MLLFVVMASTQKNVSPHNETMLMQKLSILNLTESFWLEPLSPAHVETSHFPLKFWPFRTLAFGIYTDPLWDGYGYFCGNTMSTRFFAHVLFFCFILHVGSSRIGHNFKQDFTIHKQYCLFRMTKALHINTCMA